MSYKYFKSITTPKLALAAAEDAFARFHKVISACQAAGLDFDDIFGSKNQSEMLGKIFENSAAQIYSIHTGLTVINPTSDNEPDLFFKEKNLPLEIKVTKTETWTGGTFSKRPANYWLISWDKESKKDCFIALAHLEKEDWKAGGASYYGTSYSKKKLYQAVQEGKATVLVGSLAPGGRKTRYKNPLSLLREQII